LETLRFTQGDKFVEQPQTNAFLGTIILNAHIQFSPELGCFWEKTVDKLLISVDKWV